MEELNIDKYTTQELKKLFTKHSGINCLNEFTYGDKKRKLSKSSIKNLIDFLHV